FLLTFCGHSAISSTTIPFGARTNRTLSLPFTYCSPCSPSISATAPGSGCRSSVCSNDSELPGLSAAAPATGGELSAITELKICRRCSSFNGNGQAVVGTRSSTSFRCENFAGIVCVVAPIGPGELAGPAAVVEADVLPVVVTCSPPFGDDVDPGPADGAPLSGVISAARAS